MSTTLPARATAARATLPPGFRLGAATAAYQVEGGDARGRARRVDLGRVLPHPGRGGRRRHRRRRVRPLPALALGPRPDGRPAARELPLLDRLAARPARGPRPRQPARRRVLPPARGGAARARHRAGGDALPLGPAVGAPGRGRLGGARHRRALRRVRGADGRPARRRRAAVDHPQRAVGGRVPRARRGGQGARHPRLGDGPARLPPPAALARAGGAGAARARRALRAGRDHAQPRAGAPGVGLARRPRRGASAGRPPQPLVPRSRAARRVSAPT